MNKLDHNDGRWYPDNALVGVAVVIFRDGQVLMAKRGKEPSKGKGIVPGGKVELGETIYEAAWREVLEECCVEIDVEDVIDAYDIIIRDDDGTVKYHFVDVYFTAKYKRGEARAQSDVDECRWFAPEEIAGLDMPEKLKDLMIKHKIITDTARRDGGS
jgi:ADP-ribose pyrophosphatase